jgi:succinate dehydrogenase / fumarate reductase, membrane anchor subunit
MTATGTTAKRQVKPARSYDAIAWSWMRYSGFQLIFLAFGHIFIQDVLVGVHNIDLKYVQVRWDFVAWRIYDTLLLAFAFAHGMNGLRQVLFDYVHASRPRSILSWALFGIWLVISIIGAIAIIGGVRPVS